MKEMMMGAPIAKVLFCHQMTNEVKLRNPSGDVGRFDVTGWRVTLVQTVVCRCFIRPFNTSAERIRRFSESHC